MDSIWLQHRFEKLGPTLPITPIARGVRNVGTHNHTTFIDSNLATTNMHLSSAIQAAVVCLAPLAQAAKLTVSIPAAPPLLPNPAALPPSTHATLLGASGQHYDARLTRSNALVFKDLKPGSYLLDVHSRDYFFPAFRVDVSLTSPGADESESQSQELIQVWQTFMGNEWSNLGPSYGEQKGELMVTLPPTGRKDYYQRREGFNILGFFKSPMILMGLFSVAMIFGMPYLMENSEFGSSHTDMFLGTESLTQYCSG